jgi:hypothetical protein
MYNIVIILSSTDRESLNLFIYRNVMYRVSDIKANGRDEK